MILPQNDHITDVLVAGAGPAGSTIARLLAKRGRRVTLVDPETRGTDRLEILPPCARSVIEALDLTESFTIQPLRALVSVFAAAGAPSGWR